MGKEAYGIVKFCMKLEILFIYFCLGLCAFGGIVLVFPLNIISVGLFIFSSFITCLVIIEADIVSLNSDLGDSYESSFRQRRKMYLYKYLSDDNDNNIKIFLKKLKKI